MLFRTLFILVAILTLISVAQAQSESPENILKSLDFGSVVVGVSKTKKGAKRDSHFVDVYGGFALTSIDGCRVTLRNEGVDRGRKFIYDVVIPLSDLDEKSDVGQAIGEVAVSKPAIQTEFFPWTLYFGTKGQRRSITLHDRIRKSIRARGAHLSFGLRDRAAMEKLREAFVAAIRTCRKKPG